MKLSYSRLIAVAAASAIGATCTLVRAQSQGSSAQQGKQQQSSGQQAPEGFILIREDVVTLTANEPQNHFIRAHEYLTRGDLRAAAAETRIAAAYLDMQASRDRSDKAGGELKSAADNLRQLAGQIQQGVGQQTSVHEANAKDANGQSQQSQQKADTAAHNPSNQQNNGQEMKLTEGFGRANHALAMHFQAEADRELQAKKHFMAGYDLDASASALRAYFTWSGQKPSQEANTAIADARRAADDLITPAAQRQSGSKDQSSSNTNANTNTNAEEDAQPAAARISGNDQESAKTPTSGTQQQMQEEQKAIQELGKAIQSQNNSGSTASPRNRASNTDNNKPANGGTSGTPRNDTSSSGNGK